MPSPILPRARGIASTSLRQRLRLRIPRWDIILRHRWLLRPLRAYWLERRTRIGASLRWPVWWLIWLGGWRSLIPSQLDGCFKGGHGIPLPMVHLRLPLAQLLVLVLYLPLLQHHYLGSILLIGPQIGQLILQHPQCCLQGLRIQLLLIKLQMRLVFNHIWGRGLGWCSGSLSSLLGSFCH